MRGLVVGLAWVCAASLSSSAAAQAVDPNPAAPPPSGLSPAPATPAAPEAAPSAPPPAVAQEPPPPATPAPELQPPAPLQPSAASPQPPSAAPAQAEAYAKLEPRGDQLELEAEAERDFDPEMGLRVQNTWFGPTGGVRVVDASSGPVGTGRLQFGFDYFTASDYLANGDEDQRLSGVLALSLTPAEHVEAFLSLSTHANTNTLGNPELLQVAGDLMVGVKGYTQLLPWLSVGGDVRLTFMNTIGDLGVVLDGTSIGLRALASADLRRQADPVPLLVRANLEYLFDNSSALIEAVEDARYDNLEFPERLPRANEDKHLITRVERFALGINRLDMLSIGLGAEAPLRVMDDFFIHPLLEWRLGIPVNRQGWSCLAVSTNASRSDADGCLAVEGISAAPSTLTLGARVLPPVRGLSALLAFDIGLLGSSTFVRELAPNRPWALMVALAYAVDTRPPEPNYQWLHGEPGELSDRTRVRGFVLERGFGTAILGAIVRYPDLGLSPQLTGPDGGFVSYELESGVVNLEITHPDYEPGRCSATIPPQPAVGAPAVPNPYGGDPTSPAPDGQASAAVGGEVLPFVDLRCELIARPRSGSLNGQVVDDQGRAVAGVSVDISGPTPQRAISDAAGGFRVAGLGVGDYVARVDAPAYLLKSQAFGIGSAADTSLQLVLLAKPKDASVTLTAKEVKIRRQVMFMSSSAEIDEGSAPLMSEIADVLLRNPQAASVEVQGHTDNVGDPAANLVLSQQRAEAVVRWLVSAGVAPERLEAKGYGDTHPLVPNLTPGNRARNRRVQFIVR